MCNFCWTPFVGPDEWEQRKTLTPAAVTATWVAALETFEVTVTCTPQLAVAPEAKTKLARPASGNLGGTWVEPHVSRTVTWSSFDNPVPKMPSTTQVAPLIQVRS